MSRIGKLPVQKKEGVEVNIDNYNITIKGPKGTLNKEIPKGVDIEQDENNVYVNIQDQYYKNLWGLTRTLIQNMVDGVTEGYQIKLVVFGVGYAAKVDGSQVTLNLGYSHPVYYTLPEGVSADVEKDSKGTDTLVLNSINKELIGQVAAKIKYLRPPEPYKGKGIRYEGETIKLKAGKAGKK